jgi:hypothetical protein
MPQDQIPPLLRLIDDWRKRAKTVRAAGHEFEAWRMEECAKELQLELEIQTEWVRNHFKKERQ